MTIKAFVFFIFSYCQPSIPAGFVWVVAETWRLTIIVSPTKQRWNLTPRIISHEGVRTNIGSDRIGLNYRIGPGFLCYGHFFFDILFFMHSWKRFTAYKTIFTPYLHSNIKKNGPNITPPIYIYSQMANVGYARLRC